MKKLPFILFVFLICTIIVYGQTEVETLIKKSEEFRRQSKYSEAVDALTKAIEIQPDNADLYLRRYEAYLPTNSKEAAISDVKKAAALAPNDWRIINNAAIFLMNLEQCNEALNVLDIYISQDSAMHHFFSLRSQAKSCLKDLFRAYDDLSTAIKRPLQ